MRSNAVDQHDLLQSAIPVGHEPRDSAPARSLPQFNFAKKTVSMDVFMASLDDRVVAALIPLAALIMGLVFQFWSAHQADGQADAIRDSLAKNQPQIASVVALATEYDKERREYIKLQDTRFSGPRLARSIAAWMSRLSPQVTLASVTVSGDGAGITVSGQGPSLDAVKRGVIDAVRGSCLVKRSGTSQLVTVINPALSSPGPDCNIVASATLLAAGKEQTYTITTAAASPTPSPAPVATAAASTGTTATPAPQTTPVSASNGVSTP